MSRRNRGEKTQKPDGPFGALPYSVMDSKAYIGASDHAKSLLNALIRQLNGRNNGHLHLANSWLKPKGWPSASRNQKSRDELIERSLIIQTRQGGLNAGGNLFAVTWLAIDNFVGLDVTAQTYHKGGYLCCNLEPTQRRKPPTRNQSVSSDNGNSENYERSSGYRNRALPTTGSGEIDALPTTGRETGVFGNSALPTTGNNVSMPYPGAIVKGAGGGVRRVVGRAGRSGKPKSAGHEGVMP